jgi:hypothetical protein
MESGVFYTVRTDSYVMQQQRRKVLAYQMGYSVAMENK